jgi:hypothetical protein
MQGDLATKADIDGIKAEIEALRADTKSEIAALRTETRADFRSLEARFDAKLESTKSEIIRWVVGIVGFQTVAMIGAVVTMLRMLKP